ncbi:MAG: TonB-dependent receptor plug domain-containing protein [Candidatus Krumholzibacteriia bacterium]
MSPTGLPIERRRHSGAGRAALAILTIGLFAVEIAPACVPLPAAADGANLLDLSLAELLNVEITTPSRRAESVEAAPGIVTVITRQEIEGYDARNLGEILNRVTSAIFISANVMTDNQLVMRRQSLTPYDTHILILLDGRPLRDPIAGGLNNAVYAVFPVDAIEFIEVVRGPGSVLYGSNAYAGVINIHTRRHAFDGGESDVSVTAGAWGGFGQSAVVASRRGEAHVLVAGGRYRDDGPRYTFTDYSGLDSSARWGRETTALLAVVSTGHWSGKVYFGDFDPYSLNTATNSWMPVSHDPANRSAALFADLGWEGRLPAEVRTTANVTYNNHRWYCIDDRIMDESMVEASDVLGEVTASRGLGDDAEVIAGGTVQRSIYRSELLIDGTETAWSLYGQCDWQIEGQLKLVGGAQFNKPQRTAGIVSPRLGLIVTPGRGFGGKLLYSQAFRSGSRLETAFDHPVFRGNEQLDPEIVDTGELQVSWRGGPAQFAATGYFSRMSHIIQRVWFDDPTVPVYGGYLIHENGGRQDFSGVEFEWKVAAGHDLLFEGSLSQMRDETADGRVDWTLHPELMIKTGLLWTQPWGSFGAWHSRFANLGRVQDFAPFVASPNPDAESFDLLSARLTLDAGRWLGLAEGERLHLSVWGENLLDEDVRYPEFTTRGINTLTPLRGGRALYGSVQYGF